MGVIEVGNAIRAARLARAWTQVDLGARIGISRESISNYENGDIQVIADATLRLFAVTLDIPFYHLVAMLHDITLPTDVITNARNVLRTLNLPPDASVEEARLLHLLYGAVRSWLGEMGIDQELLRDRQEREQD